MKNRARLFEEIAESLPQIVWTATPDGTVTYYNKRWWEFTGFTQEEGLGSGWKVVLHPEDEKKTMDAWQHSVKTGEPYEIEHRIITSTGIYKWVLSKGLPVRDEYGKITAWYGSATDINKLKETEDKLRVTTEKNNLLMKEVVHRTKNTLQLVESLINLQINKHSGEISEILKVTHSRIKSIALLHQELNEKVGINSINSNKYFNDLLVLISDILYNESRSVSIISRIEAAEVPINTAVNLGLIANELITNAFKYAFPNGDGRVEFNFYTESHSGSYIMEIKDNGIGINSNKENNNSLGLQIVHGLVEQSSGTININTDSGTNYKIVIPA